MFSQRPLRFPAISVSLPEKNIFSRCFSPCLASPGFYLHFMEKKYIDGIYNYCDRWCERCAFTNHCRLVDYNKEIEKEMGDKKESRSNKLQFIFDKVKNMLLSFAEKQGIELESVTLINPGDDASHAKMLGEIRQHPLILLCREYQDRTTKITENESAISEPLNRLLQQAKMGFKNLDEIRAEDKTLFHCFETIFWYLYHIEVKMARALYSHFEEYADPEDEDLLNDANGSAKVALLGIEKRRAAWEKLYEHMPEHEDEVLQCLAALSRLQQRIVEFFPTAMEFKRPGFDDKKYQPLIEKFEPANHAF